MFHPGCDPEGDFISFYKLDWSEERDKYEICYDKSEGRYLKARRDIEPGELIIEESPMIRAPVMGGTTLGCSTGSSLICLGCYNLLTGGWVSCSNCGGTLCSVKCKDSADHQMECSFFAKQNMKNTADQNSVNYYDIILPLRILSLRKKPEVLWKPFWKLMSHLDEFKQNKEWLEKQKIVSDFILKKMKIPDVTEEMILTILAIDAINGRTMNFGGVKMRLIHPLSSLISHDCNPNMSKYFYGVTKGNYLQIRSTRPIKKGEKLTISYYDALMPTPRRQKMLKEKHLFDCKCTRCLDPTDNGTFGNSLLCQQCSGGINSPPNWKCNKCNSKRDQVSQIIDKATNEAMSILTDKTKWNSKVIGQFLQDYSRSLHPNHMLFLKVKSKLMSLPEFNMENLEWSKNHGKMEQKVKILRENLAVIDKVQPGLSTTKGLILYDIHRAMFAIAQQKIEASEGGQTKNGDMVPMELKKQVNDSLNVLNQCLEHLQYDQDGTYENAIFKGAVLGLMRNGEDVPEKYRKLLGEYINQNFG